MELKPEEITKIIRSQIKNYENKIEVSETGVVILVGDGIAKASGLEKCMAGELVEFPDGSYGMAQNLEEDTVSIVILGSDQGIKEGDTVKRTGRVVSVPVGEKLIGRVVNALGEPIDGKGSIEAEAYRAIEMPAPGIIERQHVSRPLQTGIKAIDSMIPIGRGQRELIIGDRQTGKTTIATDTILNQKGMDTGKLAILEMLAEQEPNALRLLDRLEELRMLIAAKADVNSDVPFVLSTIHSSKGLEYDRVVLLDENEMTAIMMGFPTLEGLSREEIDALYDGETCHCAATDDGAMEADGSILCEVAALNDTDPATPLMLYAEDYYAGCPAVAVHAFGKGQAYYLASRFNADFYNDFYAQVCEKAGLQPAWPEQLPAGVLATRRGDFVFMQNCNDHSVGIDGVELEKYSTRLVQLEPVDGDDES